jgi:hypothetical protein
MRQRELKRLMAMVEKLSPNQRRVLKDELVAGDGISTVADIIEAQAGKPSKQSQLFRPERI